MGFLVLMGLRLMTSILTKRKRHVCSNVAHFFFGGKKWSKELTYSTCDYGNILPIESSNALDRYNIIHFIIVALDCIVRFYKKVLISHPCCNY